MANVMEASLLGKFLTLLFSKGVREIHARIPRGMEMAPDLSLRDCLGTEVSLNHHDLGSALLEETQIVAASVDLSKKAIFDRLDLCGEIAPDDGHVTLCYRIGGASLDLMGWSVQA